MALIYPNDGTETGKRKLSGCPILFDAQHPIEPTFIQVMDTHTYPAIIIHIWLSSYKSVISFIQIRLSSYKSVISFMQIRLSSYKSGFHRTGGGYLHCFSIVFRMQVVAYHHTFPAIIIQICHIIHTFLAINCSFLACHHTFLAINRSFPASL